MTETYNQMLARVRERWALCKKLDAYIATDETAIIDLIEHQARLIELARGCLESDQRNTYMSAMECGYYERTVAELSGDKPVE